MIKEVFRSELVTVYRRESDGKEMIVCQANDMWQVFPKLVNCTGYYKRATAELTARLRLEPMPRTVTEVFRSPIATVYRRDDGKEIMVYHLDDFWFTTPTGLNGYRFGAWPERTPLEALVQSKLKEAP